MISSGNQHSGGYLEFHNHRVYVTLDTSLSHLSDYIHKARLHAIAENIYSVLIPAFGFILLNDRLIFCKLGPFGVYSKINGKLPLGGMIGMFAKILGNLQDHYL